MITIGGNRKTPTNGELKVGGKPLERVHRIKTKEKQNEIYSCFEMKPKVNGYFPFQIVLQISWLTKFSIHQMIRENALPPPPVPLSLTFVLLHCVAVHIARLCGMSCKWSGFSFFSQGLFVLVKCNFKHDVQQNGGLALKQKCSATEKKIASPSGLPEICARISGTRMTTQNALPLMTDELTDR